MQNVNQLEQDILQAIQPHNSIGKWKTETQTAFGRTAIHVFFHHNLYQATKLFMSRAKGSFGLITASTLSEASLVLSAWGQPISTGFNVQDEYMVYASEPAAVDAVLSDIPRSYRLDLEQKSGEIAWFGVDRIAIYFDVRRSRTARIGIRTTVDSAPRQCLYHATRHECPRSR
jgi:hypothetical protein